MERIREEFDTIAEKAELLKALAHPIRLCIVRGLIENGPCNVTRMQVCLDAAQSTISQHLAKLRAAGVIVGERNGVEVHYRIAREDVSRMISALFETDKKRA